MPDIALPCSIGTPCWVDLTAKSQRESLDFYCGLLGWKGEPGPEELSGYAICELDGKAVAGIGQALAGMGKSSVWTSYLASTDAHATQEAIVAAGGAVLVPVVEAVGKLGRMLLASDPQGAVFGIWEPGEFSGVQAVNEAGALTWIELRTNDVAAAAAFYGAAFDLLIEPVEGKDSYWDMWANGRLCGGVTLLHNAPPGGSAHWLTYFAVDDVDSTVEGVVKGNGRVLAPPADMMAGRVSVVTDPQGAMFALIQSHKAAGSAG
ncbi:VOC family protein [Streptomyces chattanoogensis]|uniref:VOC family protein n=1 Tax=Streptomyces chattanoogensis TaxID=66876 RepID=UPI0036A1DE41